MFSKCSFLRMPSQNLSNYVAFHQCELFHVFTKYFCMRILCHILSWHVAFLQCGSIHVFFKFSFSSNTFGKKEAIGLLFLMTNHNNTKLFKGMRGEPVISYSSLFLTTSVMLRSVLPLLLLHKSQSGCPKKGRERDSFLPL